MQFHVLMQFIILFRCSFVWFSRRALFLSGFEFCELDVAGNNCINHNFLLAQDPFHARSLFTANLNLVTWKMKSKDRKINYFKAKSVEWKFFRDMDLYCEKFSGFITWPHFKSNIILTCNYHCDTSLLNHTENCDSPLNPLRTISVCCLHKSRVSDAIAEGSWQTFTGL